MVNIKWIINYGSGNVDIGGTLGVTGASLLDGAVDINAAADISGTLTLSKDSGTGLAVTKNARWWYFRR